ncbi:MAG: hypothetical protein WAL88_01655 [Nitrosotalea sp.]
MESKYVCAQCGYPAINETIFRELESPFKETLECPKCNSTKIIPERNYAFRWGWRIIRESGTDKKVQEIPGTFLQLSKSGDELSKGSMRREDLPDHVVQEFDEKSVAINRILKESGILDKLTKLGVNLHYNITVYDSTE